MMYREDVVSRPWKIVVGIVAIIFTLVGQNMMDSLVLASKTA